MTKKYVYPALFLLWLVGSAFVKRDKKVVHIKMYAFPVAAKTRIPIDSVRIRFVRQATATVENPDVFLKRLARSIENRHRNDGKSFLYHFVRILYVITYDDRSTNTILVDSNRSLLYNGQIFYTNNQVLRVLLSPVRKEERKRIGVHYTTDYLKP